MLHESRPSGPWLIFDVRRAIRSAWERLSEKARQHHSKRPRRVDVLERKSFESGAAAAKENFVSLAFVRFPRPSGLSEVVFHKNKRPNKALEPTACSVTPRAFVPSSEMKQRTAFPKAARVVPEQAVAHL